MQKVDFVPVQQSLGWAKLQEEIGSRSWRIGAREDSGKLIAFVQIFEKAWPLGLRWLHVPRGPIFQDAGFRIQDTDINNLIFSEIRKLAEEIKSVFVKFDFFKDYGHPSPYALNPSPYSNFPDTTLVLDLKKSEEELLTQMKPKGRYNIRVAEKHGIKVRETSEPAAAKIFYDLLKKTTERDGFAGHPLSYYEKFLEILDKQNLASCFIAEKDNKPLAASLCTFYGDTATYYYGASDYEFRNLMAPYAVQWSAIRAAKERGFKYYDFLGITPEGVDRHPLAGVTSFKKKFGGRVVSYPKSSELVLRPWIYKVIKIIKKLKG